MSDEPVEQDYRLIPMEDYRRLIFAVMDAGPHPHAHYKALSELREQWPTLWQAIYGILPPDIATRMVQTVNKWDGIG